MNTASLSVPLMKGGYLWFHKVPENYNYRYISNPATIILAFKMSLQNNYKAYKEPLCIVFLSELEDCDESSV